MADKDSLSPPGGPDANQSLLAQISTQMVRAMKKYYGKGPTQAKSYIFDDLLFVVMRGGVVAAERTLVESGQEDAARRFRQVFENEMNEQLVYLIEQLTGRRVINYQSQVLYDPDLVIEIFVFDEAASSEQMRHTIESLQRPESDVGGSP